jgi:hypothetical protein
VSVAWCKSTRAGATTVVASGTGNDICSSTMLGLLTFFLGSFQFSDDDDNCGFSQWVDPQPLIPIRITSTTSTTSSSTTCSGAWTKHLLPQTVPPTTSAALVRLALVNATRRWEIGLLFLHLHHHHRTCRLSSPQAAAPCSLASSRTTSFRM